MEILVSIGQRLREQREAMGMSQSDFAAIAASAGVPGATRQSQAKYEKGQVSPGAAYLAALEEAGVDVGYVLTGVDEATRVRRAQHETGTRLARAALRETLVKKKPSVEAEPSDPMEERARLHREAGLIPGSLLVRDQTHQYIHDPTAATSLTAAQRVLLSAFSRCSTEDQTALLQIVRTLAQGTLK